MLKLEVLNGPSEQEASLFFSDPASMLSTKKYGLSPTWTLSFLWLLVLASRTLSAGRAALKPRKRVTAATE